MTGWVNWFSLLEVFFNSASMMVKVADWDKVALGVTVFSRTIVIPAVAAVFPATTWEKDTSLVGMPRAVAM